MEVLMRGRKSEWVRFYIILECTLNTYIFIYILCVIKQSCHGLVSDEAYNPQITIDFRRGRIVLDISSILFCLTLNRLNLTSWQRSAMADCHDGSSLSLANAGETWKTEMVVCLLESIVLLDVVEKSLLRRKFSSSCIWHGP